MKLKDTPIQRKLLSVIMLTCAVVLSLMCAAYIIFEYYSFRQTLKTHVSTLGIVIASNSSGALAFQSTSDANEILTALQAEKHIVAACLYDNDGNIFVKYPADAPSTLFPPASGKHDVYWFDGNYLQGFQPVLQKNQPVGTLYIKSDLEAMYAQLRHYALLALLFIAGSLFVAYLLSKLLQKSISEPILALKQTTKIISEQHDYSVRAVKSGEDEVGALTDAFNQMLTQIQNQNKEITAFNQNLEQKVSERTQALQQQKEFVETIINSSVDLIAVFDKELNYIMLNKHADDLYSKKRENIIGKNIFEVYPETKNSGMIDDLKRALNGEAVRNTKYKSGLLNRFFENYYIPLKDKDDKVYGVLTIGHDITEIVDANEKLEIVNAELLKSNRDLEQFAYIASHDLQEPLRKIQTFTQLMGKSLDQEERLIEYQEKIKQSAARMQDLIREVLNFSRISNSEEAYVDTDLNVILENLKIDFELPMHEKDATITYAPLPTIKGIPLQLTQLFSNLISNSLKYNDKKPVITISANQLTAEEKKRYPKLNGAPSYIKIQFTDNGIGFEEQFSEQIFKNFQRLHGKLHYTGTGIGLALCRKIVENHHGIISAHSEPDKGATFNIILPAK
ncbi:MAG: ATP-binding protein [Bacteroidia bacterium]